MKLNSSESILNRLTNLLLSFMRYLKAVFLRSLPLSSSVSPSSA